jgi:DNA-binding LacI/PurR family transcriptional regulator
VTEPATPRKRITASDIAREAGVSRPLVSIVMRNMPGASEETRQKVLKIAAELGYRPDPRARSMAGKKSWLVGVLFGTAGTFHFDLLDALYQEAESAGFNLVLSAITANRNEEQALDVLFDFGCDGLIMLGPPNRKPTPAGRFPVSVIGWSVTDPRVDSVRTSDEAGMQALVSHLSDLGHQSIAHITGGSGSISESRSEAYKEAMRKSGLGTSISTIAGGETQIDGRRAAKEIVAAPDRPSAIICYNDDVAVAVISALEQQSIRVPDDISVTGWDDSETATLSDVPLTTVAQDAEAMANAAFHRVLNRLSGKEVDNREIVLNPELIVRSSTGPAR